VRAGCRAQLPAAAAGGRRAGRPGRAHALRGGGGATLPSQVCRSERAGLRIVDSGLPDSASGVRSQELGCRVQDTRFRV